MLTYLPSAIMMQFPSLVGGTVLILLYLNVIKYYPSKEGKSKEKEKQKKIRKRRRRRRRRGRIHKVVSDIVAVGGSTIKIHILIK